MFYLRASTSEHPVQVRRGGGCSRAAGRLRGHPRALEMGSGDPEVLPSGLHHRCASVDPGSMSEDEVELPVVSESAVPAVPESAVSLWGAEVDARSWVGQNHE